LRKEAKEKAIMDKYGWIGWCDCGEVMNGAPCEKVGEHHYQYTCTGCGQRTTLLFGPPVPITISKERPGEAPA
jgi:hypothetical protein